MQCLALTAPLTQIFFTHAYEVDLVGQNALGTHGRVAAAKLNAVLQALGQYYLG